MWKGCSKAPRGLHKRSRPRSPFRLLGFRPSAAPLLSSWWSPKFYCSFCKYPLFRNLLRSMKVWASRMCLPVLYIHVYIYMYMYICIHIWYIYIYKIYRHPTQHFNSNTMHLVWSLAQNLPRIHVGKELAVWEISFLYSFFWSSLPPESRFRSPDLHVGMSEDSCRGSRPRWKWTISPSRWTNVATGCIGAGFA